MRAEAPVRGARRARDWARPRAHGSGDRTRARPGLRADAPRHVAVDGRGAEAVRGARLRRNRAVPLQSGRRDDLYGARALDLENVQQGPAVIDLDARAQVKREADVPLVEPALALPLTHRVHREPAGALEPLWIACAAKELEKGEAVTGRAVAEAGSLAQRAGGPDELARAEQERVQLAVG